jgi:CRISPR-associated protein Cas1
VFLRKKQYALSDDETQALPIAKSIVQAKIRNELSFIQRIKRKKENNDNILQTVNCIKNIVTKIKEAQSISQLRGYEGHAAREYFSAFRQNLIPDWADFPNRSKNPPLTNVNAVLGFLYTLLMYRVETAVEIAGLDPMAGFFHQMEYGKNTLVFDLMEEFRTPIADTLCCALFNRGVVSPDDFINDGPAVLLSQGALKKVISSFEQKLAKKCFYPALAAELPLGEIIIEQVKL